MQHIITNIKRYECIGSDIDHEFKAKHIRIELNQPNHTEDLT